MHVALIHYTHIEMIQLLGRDITNLRKKAVSEEISLKVSTNPLLTVTLKKS